MESLDMMGSNLFQPETYFSTSERIETTSEEFTITLQTYNELKT
jgi:hypothetical protein